MSKFESYLRDTNHRPIPRKKTRPDSIIKIIQNLIKLSCITIQTGSKLRYLPKENKVIKSKEKRNNVLVADGSRSLRTGEIISRKDHHKCVVENLYINTNMGKIMCKHSQENKKES